jgi:hypothetical protein
MPIVTGRTTANKKIVLPGGGTVLVPVITQLNVVDSTDRYQETDYTVINNFYDPVTNKQTHRQTHVDQIDDKGVIDNSQPYPPGDTSRLPVERVDVWPVLDPVDRAQESDITLFNDQTNYDPNGPPFFTRHKASHVVRVQNDPDDGNYVDVELIDELDWVDPVDRGQETHLQLNQPQGTYDSNSGMYVITADPSDPDITDTSGNIDPAWRLDPFQNIVGWSGGYIIVLNFYWADYAYDSIKGVASLDGSNANEFADANNKRVLTTNRVVTLYPPICGFAVPNHSTVTVVDPQSSVVLLNPGVHAVMTGSTYADFRTSGTDCVPPSLSTTIPPDPGPDAWIGDFFEECTTPPYYCSAFTLDSQGITFYLKAKSVSAIDPSNLLGDIQLVLTGSSSVSSTAASEILTASITYTSSLPGAVFSSETLTDSWGNVQIIHGIPGISGFSAAVYSGKDFYWDATTQTLKSKNPTATFALSVTGQSTNGVESIPGNTSSAWAGGSAVLRLAMTQVPDPNNPNNLLSIPVIWVQSPGPILTLPGGEPFGAYYWRSDKYGVRDSNPIAFGTPP